MIWPSISRVIQSSRTVVVRATWGTAKAVLHGSVAVRQSCAIYAVCQPSWRQTGLWLALALGCFLAVAATAGDGVDDLLDTLAGSELADQILADAKTLDLDRIRDSHLSDVRLWQFVKPARPDPKQTAAGISYRWQVQGDWAAPLGPEPISTRIIVPTGGQYRVWIRQHLSLRTRRPVTMTIQSMRAVPADAQSVEPSASDSNSIRAWSQAGAPLSHVFGLVALSGAVPGGKQEATLPIRFEAEHQRALFPPDPVVIWEYWDAPLDAGIHEISLATSNTEVRVRATFLTRSKDFRPSLAESRSDNTLSRLYLRYRLLDAQPAGGKFNIKANLTYHWGRRVEGSTEPVWGWFGGGVDGVPAGEWSPFIDVTDAAVGGPGPWSTWCVSAAGLQKGRLAVQAAWTPHEAAVMSSFETIIDSDGAMFRFPNGSAPLGAGPEPAWGVWNARHFEQVMPQEAVFARYFEWARQAERRLGLKDGSPKPRLIRLCVGCNVNQAFREQAAEMLSRLGVNWIAGVPESVAAKYGLHTGGQLYNVHNPRGYAAAMTPEQRLRVEKIKMGDEISTYTSPEQINSDPVRLAKFHHFLRSQTEAEGADLAAFFGVSAPEDLTCMAALPENPGRFERRLYYHSQRFCHLVTADDYRDALAVFKELFPNALVYNNYSPHPVFLTGRDMNMGDWFVLCRNQAQSLGWAEDWATGGSWGLGTDYQCTSFYAALVECAARKHGQRTGFYVGVNCGGGARKVFSCLARGLTWLEMYAWGPLDGLAEGSNSWSDNPEAYYDVMCAAHAIGPADAIIAEGRREPRRVAVLYNRSHEILGGAGRLNHDWMWTYLGLAVSHIPADVIIEEDLNSDDLQRYRVLFLGGFNIEARRLGAIREWVEKGGVLIAAGGAASRDVYNDPLPAAAELFGAEQRPIGPRDMRSCTTAAFDESELFPSGATLATEGPFFMLKPVGTGRQIAAFAGGDCAAVMNAIGAGRTVLLGFQPGLTFRKNRFAADGSQADGSGRAWLAAPALAILGRPRADLDYHRAEVTLFEHESGLAVLLAVFGPPAPEDGCVLSIAPGREIRQVESALHGPLKWTRNNDRIEVKTPRLAPVDVIILR